MNTVETNELHECIGFFLWQIDTGDTIDSAQQHILIACHTIQQEGQLGDRQLVLIM